MATKAVVARARATFRRSTKADKIVQRLRQTLRRALGITRNTLADVDRRPARKQLKTGIAACLGASVLKDFARCFVIQLGVR